MCRKILLFFFALILFGCSGVAKKTEGPSKEEAISKEEVALQREEPSAKAILEGKKILMIIAEKNFRDEELFVPREKFENLGAEVIVASTTTNEVKGMLNGVCKPDILIKDVNVEIYDAIIFVGGSGSRQYFDDPLAHKIANDASKKDKVLAAICIAPITLAKAGLLKGKSATVWSGMIPQLKANNVNYVHKDIVVDGNIITANGPQAAEEFADAIIEKLQKVSAKEREVKDEE
jgi:protease I